MEQSSARNPMQGLSHAASQGSLPPEYWNSLDSIYSDTQLQSQPSQQQEPASHQTPTGIGWDHPVFQQQQQQPQAQPQQRGHHAPQTELPNHGIYSSIPQSWHPNPLQQPPRGYSASSQFQTHQQPPQYQQGQMTFDSRSLNPSESSAFPSYSYQPNYFHPQQLPESFQGRPNQQTHQSTDFEAAPQSSTSQFHITSGYPQDLLNNPIDLTNDFRDAQPGVPQHHTIDPSFLNPALQNTHQQQPLQNNFLYGGPAEFQTPDGRMFNYYQNDLSVRPQLGTHTNTALPSNGFSRITGLPQPQVVIPVQQSGATKKQAQTKKTGAKTQKKTQGQPESDSSDGSDLEIEAPDEPSPIPPTRPTEPIAAAEYDTLQAVWSPRNKWPSADKIKGALVDFKDVIKVLRDAWKDQVQAMKLAENQGDNDKAAKLKQETALQRRVMDKIVVTTLSMGHPTIVEKLGEHPMVLSVFYSFLADRFQAADYEGSLTVNLLKAMARFVTVDDELLQKTNMAKLLPKFSKKGGQSIKDLAREIQDNAMASTKRKQDNANPGKEDLPSKSTGVNSPLAELAGSKRPREGDSNGQPATKRMVVNSNPKEAGKPAAVANGPTKPGVQNGKPANAAAPRPRTNIVAPKPSSLFGTLSSASKRPGTTNAERTAAAAAKPTPAAEKKEKPAAPPPKPAFSFGDILADLSKPKESVVAKPAEDKPLETEEERQKRLRKESRRKLRVSWKPDDSLTEVRLFTHDPDEELDPGDGSLRGVGDVKGEGSVLKLHKDLEELEEDDLGGIRETSLHDYSGLSEIIIESEEQKGANFIKRGGTQQPSSPEKAAQEHRESTTLMVFYTSSADVPSSPKEPPAPDADEVVPDEVPFGELPDDVKARQESYFSYINPKPAAAPAQPNPPGGGFDISNLLKIIQTGQQQQSTPPPQPPQQPPQQAPMSDLERTISMFRQQQAQPPVHQAPPVPVTQPAPQAPGPAGGVDFTQILNVMKQLQQPAFPQPQQTQPGMVPNLGAMFSQFAGQNQPGHPQSQGHGTYEDPERKRIRDVAPYEDQYENPWSRQKRTRSSDPKPHKVGLVPCKFWAEGKCRKGDNCTFRHDT